MGVETDQLWRRIDRAQVTRPTWRDAPDTFIVVYAGDGKLQIERDVLRVRVRNSARGVVILGCFFIPAWIAVTLFMIPERPIRIVFSVLGTGVGIATFAAIHALLRYHHQLGHYLEIDRRPGKCFAPPGAGDRAILRDPRGRDQAELGR